MNPGTQIDRGHGRIVVDKRLGAGAMGTVYRAWLFHAPHGPRAHEPPMLVALKQLKPHAAMHPELRALFQNEADALSRLDHPNVVRFHDLFEWVPPPPTMNTSPISAVSPGSFVASRPSAAGSRALLTLAMEFVDGDNLETVISRQIARARLAGAHALPGMPFQRAFSYFEQLLGALAAAHALGIVHRDVKPPNVMIRRDGITKLTDFGIVHFIDTTAKKRDEESSGRLTPGTGAYMSPEQVLGEPIDGRSDLYSAAIVFYEMLTGRTPFPTEGKTEMAVRMDQVTMAPLPIRSLLPQAPPVLEQVFARALAKSARERFRTAIDLGQAFVQALGMPPSSGLAAQANIALLAAGGNNAAGNKRMHTARIEVERIYRTIAGFPGPPGSRVPSS
jgi:serine/threonine-protein kinase